MYAYGVSGLWNDDMSGGEPSPPPASLAMRPTLGLPMTRSHCPKLRSTGVGHGVDRGGHAGPPSEYVGRHAADPAQRDRATHTSGAWRNELPRWLVASRRSASTRASRNLTDVAPDGSACPFRRLQFIAAQLALTGSSATVDVLVAELVGELLGDPPSELEQLDNMRTMTVVATSRARRAIRGRAMTGVTVCAVTSATADLLCDAAHARVRGAATSAH